MCKNHQHLVANGVQGGILPSGDIAYIVDPAIENVTIQNSTGGSLTVPCCTIVLLQPPARAMVFSSQDRLMAGLAALSYASGLIESELGADPLMTLINSSLMSSIVIEPEED